MYCIVLYVMSNVSSNINCLHTMMDSHIFTVTAPVSLTDWLLQDKWHFGSISLWEAEQILAGDDEAAISSWSSASHCTHTTHQISQEGFPVPRAKDTVTFIHFYKECYWRIETENISTSWACSHDKVVNTSVLILTPLEALNQKLTFVYEYNFKKRLYIVVNFWWAIFAIYSVKSCMIFGTTF